MLEEGDFFVHFLDLADSELNKPAKDVSINKLNAFLELSLRTAISDSDPYKDNLNCSLLNQNLLQQLMTIVHVTEKQSVQVNEPMEPKNAKLSGFEAFSFDYKIEWPLSLVIGKQAIIKYQLIFRHLFFCKHVERLLCKTWAFHQTTKQLHLKKELLSTFRLRQRMLHFLQNFQYYMFFEVLESNWHSLNQKLKQVIFFSFKL